MWRSLIMCTELAHGSRCPCEWGLSRRVACVGAPTPRRLLSLHCTLFTCALWGAGLGSRPLPVAGPPPRSSKRRGSPVPSALSPAPCGRAPSRWPGLRESGSRGRSAPPPFRSVALRAPSVFLRLRRHAPPCVGAFRLRIGSRISKRSKEMANLSKIVLFTIS